MDAIQLSWALEQLKIPQNRKVWKRHIIVTLKKQQLNDCLHDWGYRKYTKIYFCDTQHIQRIYCFLFIESIVAENLCIVLRYHLLEETGEEC